VAFLNYSKFRSTLEDAVESRVLFVGHNISDSLEQTLAIGSSISAAQPIKGLIEIEKRNDTLILSIDVADDDRNILFSTEPDRVGTSIPGTSAGDFEDDGHWRQVEPGAVSLGIPVRNTFDLQVGTVVLRYASPYLDQNAYSFLQRIGVGSVALLVATVVPATLLLWVLLARMRRMFAEIEKPLEALAGGQEADEQGDIGQFSSSVRQVEVELREVERMAEAEPART
jgi:hypothetical protein